MSVLVVYILEAVINRSTGKKNRINFFAAILNFQLKEAFKNYLADFFLLGGGVTPFPLRVSGQDDFPLWGRGVPPNSAKENSAKMQVF